MAPMTGDIFRLAHYFHVNGSAIRGPESTCIWTLFAFYSCNYAPVRILIIKVRFMSPTRLLRINEYDQFVKQLTIDTFCSTFKQAVKMSSLDQIDATGFN